jgi:hypothetical protein
MRCPVCSADSATGSNCRRCRADLSLLFRLEEERARLCAAARRAILQGQGDQALALAGAMAALRPGVDCQRFKAIGMLLQRDFAGALLGYLRAIAETIAKDGLI